LVVETLQPAVPSGELKTKSAMSAQEEVPAWSCWKVREFALCLYQYSPFSEWYKCCVPLSIFAVKKMLFWISLPQLSPVFKHIIYNKFASDYLLIAGLSYDPGFSMLPEEIHCHLNWGLK
jgi:hypothetical protein